MRLIDADDLKNDVIRQTVFLSLFGGKIAEIAETLKKGILEEVEKAPTIDAVTVVRCKECKYSDECHKRVQYTRCESPTCMTLGSAPVEYCSRGRRKDDADE